MDANLLTQTDVEIIPAKMTSITLSDLFDGMGNDIDPADPPEESKDERINLELEDYKSLKGLAVVLPGGAVTDLLSWWQIHEKMLPLLSILARRMLCVPATSAPSERVFSIAGLTISKHRTSVQPQHASDLIFLHDNWEVAL